MSYVVDSNIGAIRTELGTLYHCRRCGLEDHDREYIRSHLEHCEPGNKVPSLGIREGVDEE